MILQKKAEFHIMAGRQDEVPFEIFRFQIA